LLATHCQLELQEKVFSYQIAKIESVYGAVFPPNTPS